MRKKKNNKLKKALLAFGFLVVFGTHIYMLFKPLTAEQMIPHALLNLAAGVALVFALKQ